MEIEFFVSLAAAFLAAAVGWVAYGFGYKRGHSAGWSLGYSEGTLYSRRGVKTQTATTAAYFTKVSIKPKKRVKNRGKV